jgi:uncharacterized protein YndB with AHSA1/START domain
VSAGGSDTMTIIVERDLPYPPEKVWRALTEPHLIREWLMDNDFELHDFQLMAGHKFSLRTKPQKRWSGVIDCEVVTIEPIKQLTYTWNSSGEEAADGLKTIVTFTLTAIPAGTRLQVAQAGFRPDQMQNYQGARSGWQRFLAALEQLITRL